MKIKKSTKLKKQIFYVAIVATILIGAAFFYLTGSQILVNEPQSTTKNTPIDTKNVDINEPPTQEEINAGQKQKERVLENSPPQSPVSSASITSINKAHPNLQIRVVINSLSNGTCELELRQEDRVIIEAAPIQPLASNSTCKGFDIPLDTLSSGEWLIKISIISGDSKEKILNDQVTI